MKLFKPKVEVYLLLKELYVLLKSGVSLPRALELLALQKAEISEELLFLKKDIEEGMDLSLAFQKSGIFPKFVCDMLIAAQTGTNLEEIFLKTSEWLFRMEEFKSRLINALIYPSLVISLSIIAIIFVLQFIVPKLRKILVSFGSDLPFLTKCLIFGTKVLCWSFLIFLPLVSIFLFFWIKKNGWERVHEIGLKIPVLGKLWIYFDLSKWCYITSLLTATGLVLPKAVYASAESCYNLYLKRLFFKIVSFLEEGDSLNYHLKRFSTIPVFVSELVAIGEETGTLPEMLENASELLTREADQLIEKILRWIEPITILVIAIIIAYIVFSVILPIMEISATVHF